MDQIKIGRFIAEKRRERGLTQAQLAEKLSITDRAVSKWENGRAMPDSSLMLDLCRHLKITVNDLLYGEVVGVENYNEKLEKQLLEVIKQKEEADRRLLNLEWFIIIISVLVLIVPILIAGFVEMPDWPLNAIKRAPSGYHWSQQTCTPSVAMLVFMGRNPISPGVK